MSTKRNLFRRIAQLTAREARTTDHIVVTGADGHDALIPIADITDVDPVESPSQIAAIRVETTDGTQHSATPEELATALASQPVLIGPVGPKGDKGDKGDTGAVGPVGATGPQGIAGKDAGMDYSKLTEQIVPGVFLSDLNGVKCQAYIRTFYGVIGATPTDFKIALKSAVNDGNGYIIMGQIGGVPPAYTRDFGGSAYWTYYTSGGFAHIKVAGSPSLSNAKYAFTFIYY